MNAFTKPRFSVLECIVGAIAVFLLLILAVASTSKIGEHGPIKQSIVNCRQVILSIRLYAADNGGVYPDGKVPGATDSNAVFHELIVGGSLEDEKIFGCGISPFLPDGNIGDKPDFIHAVEAGENHWAMTKGLNDASPGGIPLVYENPIEATWPPTWNADAVEKPLKGRVWKGGKVIIGTNDTSVELMKLSSATAVSESMCFGSFVMALCCFVFSSSAC